MAVAPDSQRRKLKGLELLQSAAPAPAEQLKTCLDSLRQDWQQNGNLAGLWQDWPRIAGARLAPHCRPLALQRGVLTIGASHPQWRQALQYNRPQLLAALRGAGHPVRDLRIQQNHASTTLTPVDEKTIWSRHPSRIDVHGMGTCPRCQRPSPQGEIDLWSFCGFCRRQELSEGTAINTAQAVAHANPGSPRRPKGPPLGSATESDRVSRADKSRKSQEHQG